MREVPILRVRNFDTSRDWGTGVALLEFIDSCYVETGTVKIEIYVNLILPTAILS